jgi:hypothetical protein
VTNGKIVKVHCAYARQKDHSGPCGLAWKSGRFLHAIQSGVQFKTYELLISGTFHLTMVGHGN